MVSKARFHLVGRTVHSLHAGLRRLRCFREEILRKLLPLGAEVTVCPNGGLHDQDFIWEKPNGPDDLYQYMVDKNFTFVNPYSPNVQRLQDEHNARFMEVVKDYADVKYATMNSEMEDRVENNENEAGLAQTRRTLGFTKGEIGPPKFVARGVIADDDRGYRYQQYVFKHGNGLAMANKRTSDAVHRVRPDILTVTYPYRNVTYYDMYPGVDIIGTWTYSHPDPKSQFYVETMRAVCKPEHKIPLNVVTLLVYPGMQTPGGDWTMLDAGRTKVATWINLSRAEDGGVLLRGLAVQGRSGQSDERRYAQRAVRHEPGDKGAVRQGVQALWTDPEEPGRSREER